SDLPEGLVASVMAGLPRQSPRRSRLVQLFMPTRVIRSTSEEARVQTPGTLTASHHELGPSFRGANMSEQRRGSFGKKIWIGGGLAVAAAAIAVFSGVEVPPTGKDVSGTIVPAQRYRADQPSAGDVKLGVQAGGSLNPADGGSMGGSRA